MAGPVSNGYVPVAVGFIRLVADKLMALVPGALKATQPPLAWPAWVAPLAFAVGCSRSPESPHLSPCYLGPSAVLAGCGQLRVPENRDAPRERQIDLGFAVLGATSSARGRRALLILVGGPGQAATDAGVPIAQTLAEVRRTHDVVLIDQRGTGRSHPLSCDAEDLPPLQQFSHELDAEELIGCARRLDADTTMYTTLDALPDFEAVRRHLGYDRWHLWGGSYGTRVALAYAKYYPDSVERMVLDGPAPTDIELPLHFSEDAKASLEHVKAACARQPNCEPLLRFTARATSIAERLSVTPAEITFTHPSRGTEESLRVTKEGFLGGVRALLYSTELSSLLPYAIQRIDEQGDWAPLVTAVNTLGEAMMERSSHLGMYLSVVCAEDVPRISDAEVSPLEGLSPFGPMFVRQARDWCAHWQAKVLPEHYFEPVSTPHPTLILTGARDPATPPRWGALVAERMPESLHVSVSEASHGVTPLGCAPQVIADFLTSAEPRSVATECLADLRAPLLFTHATGP